MREHPSILARVQAYQVGENVLKDLKPGMRPRAGDERISTTVRISPEGLEALKNVAAAKRVKLNDVLLEAAEHALTIHGRPMPLRMDYALDVL